VIVLGAIGIDVLVAVGVGIAAAAIAVVGIALTTAGQRSRVKQLSRASVSFDSLLVASHQVRDKEGDLIGDALRTAVSDVAAEQHLGEGLVSGVIFAHSTGGALEIVPGLTVNLEEPEAQLQARPAEAGIEEAVQTGQPVITVFRSAIDQNTTEDAGEREPIDPALCWVIAVPIASEAHEPLWVLRIAGIVEPRSEAQLRPSVGRLLYYRELLELLLRRVAEREK
jgi:hypothetical protein